MIQAVEIIKKSPLSWKLLFGLKLIVDLALAGAFYFEHSMTLLWRLGFVVISLLIFLGINAVYLDRKKRQNWLLHVLLIDFLVSAAYGYVYISGDYPNHLFIGITALAILMLVKNTRMLVLTCILLLAVYVVTMGSVDWYLYQQLHTAGYFISCSFILFAGIVSAVIQHYGRAREKAMQLHAQLLQSHEQLQEYALQTEEWAAARERVRMARDIHDTVGHKLTALLVQMQLARKLGGSDASRSQRIYLECEDLIRSSLQEVRLSVRAIRDEPAGAGSLHDSLQKLGEEFTRFTGVQTAFEIKGAPVALPRNLQLTAYRMVQESLTNAQKHGQAKHVHVALTYSESGFSLSIRNDGVVPHELKPGFGLISLQERAKEWNGEVRFYLDRNEGFAVEGAFPYAALERERVHR
ncbi:sensor histidine kinase [Paenibacillus mucilaginosus]|uniref:histidine kinase n=1 Tax=Paenibacillus mucilaginosus (strain KNP414) TaxID=1036673 RepID=F8FL20_PAEMK|nr:sensor histidine kinase [Paenibacillus mucilaginosus]AEI39939.1 histidine kinase [Paenibacillus mucilaginosus KNP414]MCG7216366.1 sensor histidine kinase [Paenibacillus mucilaginosus]WDM29201.1 sensor histidine kinase [Paenibacillus mucilaginosus]